MARLLAIEDGERPGPAFSAIIDGGWTCSRIDWMSFAFESLDRSRLDLVVAVIGSDPSRALKLFQWLRRHPGYPPLVAIMPSDATPELYNSCVEVADDFVRSPIHREELCGRIARLVRGRDAASLKERLGNELGLSNLIGRHPEFLKEIHKIPRAASSGSDVLITGETGTGKELCARAIHHLSDRQNLPLICVDCGGVPDQLFESEVFGHVRGAFTDAHRNQKGLVAMAEGGTLFLDEIDSLSTHAQTKLLRFLQDRSYRPLGSEQFYRANVRIVAATNRDLQRAMAENAFRRDLFFRINVLRLHMMPLRERADDIELLANYFLDRFCAEGRGPRKTLSASALRALHSMQWPGNIRELHNTIYRAVVFSDDLKILPSHLLSPSPTQDQCKDHRHGQGLSNQGSSDEVLVDVAPRSFREAREQAVRSFERQYVEQLLRKHGGNITHAARDADKDRRAFGRLVKRHGIVPSALFQLPHAAG